MQGKLMTKSKVIQTKRPKSQVYRRRIKPQRANTPQRWSRRIRSLPPIPINVLKPRRKVRKSTNAKQETYTSTTYLDEVKKKYDQQRPNRDRRKSVFVSKKVSHDKTDSVEVVRIVPVVVYVKNSMKPKRAFIPEEIRVHIDDSPTCQIVSQAIDSHLNKSTKHEKLTLGKRYSKRIRTMAREPHTENVPNVRRKYPSRKKLLLYQ